MANTDDQFMQATIVTSTSELEQILELQRANLVSGLPDSEKREQGFVTVVHTLELLQAMHQEAPSIIMKDEGKVVAYALTMLPACRDLIPELVPMFSNMDNLTWQGKPLNEYSFYVMGQICVDKAYRGRGLFDVLYQKHKEVYSPDHDLMVTEIATRNTRSMRAHERVGFKTINIYRDELDEWAVVVWDWKT
jgi:GNAT superfamily N-acetyltransferase